MTHSIAQLTRATIHCDTGIFTNTNKTFVTTAVFAGLTSMALGILALTNVVALPPGAAYYLVGGGSLAIQGAAVTIVVLATKHSYAKKLLAEFSEKQVDTNGKWWMRILEETLARKTDTVTNRYTSFVNKSEENLFIIMVCSGKNAAIYFFFEKKSAVELARKLHYQGYARLAINNEEVS